MERIIKAIRKNDLIKYDGNESLNVLKNDIHVQFQDRQAVCCEYIGARWREKTSSHTWARVWFGKKLIYSISDSKYVARQKVVNLLEKLAIIEEFLSDEYGHGLSFGNGENIHNIGLIYTTIGDDGDDEIQINIDVENMKLLVYDCGTYDENKPVKTIDINDNFIKNLLYYDELLSLCDYLED